MRQIVALALLALAAPVYATQHLTEQLLETLSSLNSGQMDFDQVLTDSQGRISQSFGKLSFSRPSQFKVSYISPDRLEMISNGETFWFYDIELNQVILSDTAKAQGTKGLLAVLSTDDLAGLFSISSKQDKGTNLNWLVLEPYDPAAVEMIHCEVAFAADGTLVEMTIEDLLGNYINARFTSLRPLENHSNLFDFEPPDGAEIIQQ